MYYVLKLVQNSNSSLLGKLCIAFLSPSNSSLTRTSFQVYSGNISQLRQSWVTSLFVFTKTPSSIYEVSNTSYLSFLTCPYKYFFMSVSLVRQLFVRHILSLSMFNELYILCFQTKLIINVILLLLLKELYIAKLLFCICILYVIFLFSFVFFFSTLSYVSTIVLACNFLLV